MPKQMKTCRVCGATYEACNSIKTGTSVFNWREVACSPACGELYLSRVNDARAPAPKKARHRAPSEDRLPDAPAPAVVSVVADDSVPQNEIR